MMVDDRDLLLEPASKKAITFFSPASNIGDYKCKSYF